MMITIPGTGISYVDEVGRKKLRNEAQPYLPDLKVKQADIMYDIDITSPEGLDVELQCSNTVITQKFRKIIGM